MRFADARKDFFIAASGGSATLVGLVIVAISVNLQRILQFPHLPSRGGATVGSLMLILTSSMLWLLPQPKRILGIEILVFSLLVWMLQLWSARHMIRALRDSKRPFGQTLVGMAMSQIQAIPFVIGGFGVDVGPQFECVLDCIRKHLHVGVVGLQRLDPAGRNLALSDLCS
jgi:hypothetical protein